MMKCIGLRSATAENGARCLEVADLRLAMLHLKRAELSPNYAKPSCNEDSEEESFRSANRMPEVRVEAGSAR